MMTSQLSQPSSSISARDIGRNGAVPKREAQYLRYVLSSFGAAADIEQPHGKWVGVRSRTAQGHRVRIHARTYAGKHHFPVRERLGVGLAAWPEVGWAAV